jgi:hypothetical protein
MSTVNRILGLSLRQHVGGRWAVSLLAYVLNIPLNLLAILTHITQSPTPSGALGWLGVAALGYLALGAVLLLANVTVLRHRREHPVSPWLVVLVGAIAGGARGLVVGSLAVTLALPDAGPNAVAIRVVTGIGLGAVLVPLAALFLSIIATYISQRRILIAERQEWEITRMKAEGISDGLRQAYVEAIQGELTEVVVTRDPQMAREMSRRIWESAPAPPVETRLRLGQVLRTSIMTNAYVTWPVAIIWMLSAWGPLSLAVGWPRAVAQMAVTVMVIWLAFRVGRALTQRYSRLALIIFVLVIAFIILASGPVASEVFDERSIQESLNLIVLNSIWLPLIIVMVTVITGAVRSSEDVITALTASVGDEEIRALAATSEQERIRRDVATQLHGNVQARLLASAALMRQPDLMRQLGISDPAEVLLDVGDLVTPASGEASLADQLTAVIRPWNALLETTVSMDIGDVPQALVGPTCRIIEEGLSNAFRHGEATAVDIRVSAVHEGVRVSVADNGIGLDPERQPGLGVAMVEALAPGDWSISRTQDDRTVLDVLLRIA